MKLYKKQEQPGSRNIEEAAMPRLGANPRYFLWITDETKKSSKINKNICGALSKRDSRAGPHC